MFKVFPYKISILASDNPKTSELLRRALPYFWIATFVTPLPRAGAWPDRFSLGLKPARHSNTRSVLSHHMAGNVVEQAGASPCLQYHRELGCSHAITLLKCRRSLF